MTDIAVREDMIDLMLPSQQQALEVIERATFLAEQLASIVAAKHWYAEINSKRYLEVEAWQFVGFQAGIDAQIEYTRPVTDATGAILAYESKAVLSKGGRVFSSGIMECGMISFPTQGKQGRERDKAAMSASQTWAISKAYRNRLSFIARMAGYEPTPADEMRTMSPEDHEAAPAPSGMMCPIHHVEWFKRGRMPAYAHPVENPGEGEAKWCNKADAEKRDNTTYPPRLTMDIPPIEASTPPETPQGAITNAPALFNKAMKEGTYSNAAEVLRALGCEKTEDILPMYGTFAAAWEAAEVVDYADHV